MERLDDIDIQILKELQRNAKLTVKELADKVHLSASPTFERQHYHRSLQHQAETAQQQPQPRFHGGSALYRRGDRMLQHFGRLRLHDENLCARYGALSRFCAQ